MAHALTIVRVRAPKRDYRAFYVSGDIAKVSPLACLCVDCGKVSETAQNCQHCQSKAVLNLAKVLDR